MLLLLLLFVWSILRLAISTLLRSASLVLGELEAQPKKIVLFLFILGLALWQRQLGLGVGERKEEESVSFASKVGTAVIWVYYEREWWRCELCYITLSHFSWWENKRAIEVLRDDHMLFLWMIKLVFFFSNDGWRDEAKPKNLDFTSGVIGRERRENPAVMLGLGNV